MDSSNTRVRIGYFEGFNSSNTLLFDTGFEGLRALAATFRSLGTGRQDRVSLHELAFVDAHHGVRIVATCGARDRGTRREGPGNVFTWKPSIDGWNDAAAKLGVLIHADDGHQYLDAYHDEVVVQVSKAEYGDDWWRAHG